jgi:hypothetical protein
MHEPLTGTNNLKCRAEKETADHALGDPKNMRLLGGSSKCQDIQGA